MKSSPVSLKIGWITVPISLVPIFEAKKDVTKHYGKSYTLQAIHFAGTTPQITALASGDLDIAELSYSSVALAIQNAHMDDLRMIADSLQDGVKPDSYSGPFVVMKDGPVKTIEDLKGQSVSVNLRCKSRIGAQCLQLGTEQKGRSGPAIVKRLDAQAVADQVQAVLASVP